MQTLNENEFSSEENCEEEFVNPNKRANISESPMDSQHDNLSESGSSKRKQKRPKLKLPKMIKRTARDVHMRSKGRSDKNDTVGVCTRTMALQASHSRYHLQKMIKSFFDLKLNPTNKIIRN